LRLKTDGSKVKNSFQRREYMEMTKVIFTK